MPAVSCISSIIAGRAVRPARAAWIAPATILLEGHPQDPDRREDTLVHLPRAREVLGQGHEHTLHPGHHHGDGHEPGQHHRAEAVRHQVHAGHDVPEHQHDQDGLGQGGQEQRPALRAATSRSRRSKARKAVIREAPSR